QPRAHLEISTSNAQLEDLIRIAESFGAEAPVVATGGVASLQASIDTNLNRAARGMTISGTGQMTKARLQMSQAAKPVEVVTADLRFAGDSRRIDNLAAQCGASQLTGWLQIKYFDHPLASFDLKSIQLNLSEARQMLASGPKAQAKTSGSSSIRADGQIAI